MELSSLISPLQVAGAAAPSNEGKPSRLTEASQQFEALLIGEMLKSAREAGGQSAFGGESDPSAEQAMGIAETQFAQAIAQKGGLGLGRAIESQLGPAFARSNALATLDETSK